MLLVSSAFSIKRTLALIGVTYTLHPLSHGAIVASDVIGIDFDNTSNGGIAPASSTNFNHFDGNDFGGSIADDETATFSGTLVNTLGIGVADLGFSLTNRTGQDTNRAVSNGGSESPELFSDPNIAGDRLISNDAQSTGRLTDGDAVIDGINDRGHFVLTFSGLNDNLTYDLTAGLDFDDPNLNINNANFNAIWQADGQSFTTNTESSSINSGFGTLTGLTTDGSGNLEIFVIRTGNQNGRHVSIAALTLTAVPEPSIALLTLVTGLYSLQRRRK